MRRATHLVCRPASVSPPAHVRIVPQSHRLIERVTDIGQMLADADLLRRFMTGDPGAVPQIRQNLAGSAKNVLLSKGSSIGSDGCAGPPEDVKRLPRPSDPSSPWPASRFG